MSSYDLDEAIQSFFETHTSTTRQQCDDVALSHARGLIHPVQVQGMFSYTIVVGTIEPRLFQFRCQDSTLNLDTMSLAKDIHSRFVASYKYHGTIGQSQPLHVYEMDNLPGTTYIMGRNTCPLQPPDAVFRQRNTAKDLARKVPEPRCLFGRHH